MRERRSALRDWQRAAPRWPRSLVAVLLAVACLWTCSDPASPDIRGEGVVGFWEGEGGCWSIATPSANLHPTDLPSEFKEVGLRVRFEADRRPDLVSFCPGEVVDLRGIYALP